MAKLGHEVTGIDFSKTGIDQLNQKAAIENLKIEGLVGDIFTFDNYEDFDVVLLDSMFHFEKRDRQRETDLMVKIAKRIKKKRLDLYMYSGHRSES